MAMQPCPDPNFGAVSDPLDRALRLFRPAERDALRDAVRKMDAARAYQLAADLAARIPADEPQHDALNLILIACCSIHDNPSLPQPHFEALRAQLVSQPRQAALPLALAA